MSDFAMDACYETAYRAGVANRESADFCNDGECCCPNCPWQQTAKNWRPTQDALSPVESGAIN